MPKLDKQQCLEWAFGNLLDNATRGKVAEFVVAKALGVAEGHRVEWDAADIWYGNKAVEVKSSAYVQSWKQTKPSTIRFDIGQRRYPWDARTNTMRTLSEPARGADLYIFCVLAEKDEAKADPLQTDQWRFYVVAREAIDQRLGDQKTAGLSTIAALADEIGFESLKPTVDILIRS